MRLARMRRRTAHEDRIRNERNEEPWRKETERLGKLTLKPRTETGVVRQSFSHGRSKQVVVEKVKRRSVGGAPEAKAEPAPVEVAQASRPRQTPPRPRQPQRPPRRPSRPASCCAR